MAVPIDLTDVCAFIDIGTDGASDDNAENHFDRVVEKLASWLREALLERRVELDQKERCAVLELIATAMLTQHDYDKDQAREMMAALGLCEDETGLAPFPGTPLKSPRWPRTAGE
jgi:hypothetical protein